MGIFAKARYGRAGAVTGKGLGSGMRYYTWRGREKHDGREWETGDGRTLDYKQARTEIEEYCREHPQRYMYSVIAGTKSEELGSERYREELGRDFDRVYFVKHHDQHEGEDKHPHAHVIGFRERTFKKAELSGINRRWQGVDRELERRREAERGREEARSRDPVERRAEAWRGLGYSPATARVLAERERDRGREYGMDGEAHRELGREREALYRDRRAVRGEREGHGRLEGAVEAYRDASDAMERSSRLGRLVSADARAEYERAERALGWSGRALRAAGVEDRRGVELRGEELSGREEALRGREEAWKPLEGAWRELGEVMGQRREAERRQERERGWERTDRMRGDPPGTAKAREEMDRGDEWGR